MFCVNGQLLQGYSVLRTPPAREEVTVSDLLDCLDEADMEVSPPPEQAVPSGGEVQPETPVQAPPELAAGPPPSERKQKPPPAKPAPAAKKKGPLKKRPALHITPGWEIEMSAHYYSDKNADRVAELIQLPREELAAMEEASVAKEKTIFSKCSEIETEWKKQAAETAALRKAREYLRALPVEHTSNQWKVNQFGWHVLSNMVYKMSYRVSEHKKPDGTLINCALSWDIHYNTLQHPTPDYTGPGWKIAGQSDKVFATKEEMERYLQGRIKACAHLFTEISPPIPQDQKGRFCVNGVLLPGYTVEVPERTPQEVADDLLSLLEDGDLPEQSEGAPPSPPSEKAGSPLETQAAAPHERRSPKKDPKTAHKKKPQPLKKRSTAPTR